MGNFIQRIALEMEMIDEIADLTDYKTRLDRDGKPIRKWHTPAIIEAYKTYGKEREKSIIKWRDARVKSFYSDDVTPAPKVPWARLVVPETRVNYLAKL